MTVILLVWMTILEVDDDVSETMGDVDMLGRIEPKPKNAKCDDK